MDATIPCKNFQGIFFQSSAHLEKALFIFNTWRVIFEAMDSRLAVENFACSIKISP
jgi:hypothetical protein